MFPEVYRYGMPQIRAQGFFKRITTRKTVAVMHGMEAQNGITMLGWHAQSPDMNPIEKVWAAMKLKLRQKCVKRIKQL